jgi:hypothetical protein
MLNATAPARRCFQMAARHQHEATIQTSMQTMNEEKKRKVMKLQQCFASSKAMCFDWIQSNFSISIISDSRIDDAGNCGSRFESKSLSTLILSGCVSVIDRLSCDFDAVNLACCLDGNLLLT